MSLIDKVEAVKFISDKQKQTEMSEEFKNGVSWAIARLAEVPTARCGKERNRNEPQNI